MITPESLILALDTATPIQSLAIVRGSSVLFEAFSHTQTKEGPGLLSLVDDALRHCELTIKDIDRFVVSRGPGAFTGLRVSMAMLKSLALTLNKPLYAASSLEAIAMDSLPSNDIVAACMDARRGEIYAAFYKMKDGELQSLSDELLLKPDEFIAYMEHAFPNQPIACVGPAFPNYTQKLSALRPGIIVRSANPRAAMLAASILKKFPNEMPDIPLESLEPKYIRMDDFELPKPFDFSQPGQFRAK
ncbi:MAG: tRNA (adenosine(37)-N6)-threonylcarbamoyltransferase complex dimerization subunit type 1 TsaB [Proteobacteria bacterium]|nr:tRNA (adenosine(37)-N6)-threonylcarbamoyltransferase complex dimerization subunit type 1 TsaB [Pseudomonadota bacterium]